MRYLSDEWFERFGKREYYEVPTRRIRRITKPHAPSDHACPIEPPAAIAAGTGRQGPTRSVAGDDVHSRPTAKAPPMSPDVHTRPTAKMPAEIPSTADASASIADEESATSSKPVAGGNLLDRRTSSSSRQRIETAASSRGPRRTRESLRALPRDLLAVAVDETESE